MSNIYLTDADRFRIGSLLTKRENRAWGENRWLSKLEARLEQAKTVDSHHVPEGLVTMNATIVLAELDSGKRRVFTLTYPQNVELEPNGLSIFDPLGIALLGSRVGEVVKCPAGQYDPMRVLRVVKQSKRRASKKEAVVSNLSGPARSRVTSSF